MTGKVLEVLAELISGIKHDFGKTNIVIETQKYDKKVIAAAYSWIYEKVTRDIIHDQDVFSAESFRLLSTDELNKIGEANYSYLFHFYNIGLITNDDMELIIEQLMFFNEEEISNESINILILGLFLDIDSHTLPGSRLLLYSSDTIN